MLTCGVANSSLRGRDCVLPRMIVVELSLQDSIQRFSSKFRLVLWGLSQFGGGWYERAMPPLGRPELIWFLVSKPFHLRLTVYPFIHRKTDQLVELSPRGGPPRSRSADVYPVIPQKMKRLPRKKLSNLFLPRNQSLSVSEPFGGSLIPPIRAYIVPGSTQEHKPKVYVSFSSVLGRTEKAVSYTCNPGPLYLRSLGDSTTLSWNDTFFYSVEEGLRFEPLGVRLIPETEG